MDLDNFIIGKTKENRGEGRFGKKSNSYLINIVQQLMVKDRTTSPGQVLGDLAKKSNISQQLVARSSK